MTKFECPHPDCNREFESIKSRRGHEVKAHQCWPSKDIKTLKRGYENWNKERLQKELSYRSWGSIKSKARELGLRRKGKTFLNLSLSPYQEDVLHGLILGDASCRGTKWKTVTLTSLSTTIIENLLNIYGKSFLISCLMKTQFGETMASGF